MRIVGQENIAAVFGVAVKTVVAWQQQGFPIAVHGRPGVSSEYDAADCIAWLVARDVAEVRERVVAESPRDRLCRLQADALQQELDCRRADLVRADAIDPRLRAAIDTTRSYLAGRAGELAQQLDGCDRRQRETALRKAFDAMLRAIATWPAAGRASGAVDSHGVEQCPTPPHLKLSHFPAK